MRAPSWSKTEPACPSSCFAPSASPVDEYARASRTRVRRGLVASVRVLPEPQRLAERSHRRLRVVPRERDGAGGDGGGGAERGCVVEVRRRGQLLRGRGRVVDGVRGDGDLDEGREQARLREGGKVVGECAPDRRERGRRLLARQQHE